MEPFIKIDEFEPPDLVLLIKQSLPQSVQLPLNRLGWADYQWELADGTKEQVERKQCGELLSKIDATEEQLQKEIATMQERNPNGRFILLIEGIALPGVTGIDIYEPLAKGKMLIRRRSYNTPYYRYESLLIALERQGVMVWRVPNKVATANALVYLAKSAARFEHSTLNRHIKVTVRHPDHHVQTLMGIHGERGGGSLLGPELAEQAIASLGTAWDVVRLDAETLAMLVPSIGIARAHNIMKALGKEK